VTRRRGDQGFTKNEVRRLMRVADEGGAKKYDIVVGRDERDKPTYKLSVDNTGPATDTNTNPWDEVLTDAADEKRTA
jgi:hypothetical protein